MIRFARVYLPFILCFLKIDRAEAGYLEVFKLRLKSLK